MTPWMYFLLILGLLTGWVISRVNDVRHVRRMVRLQSEALLKSNLDNFKIGWDDCFDIVISYDGDIAGLRHALITVRNDQIKRERENTEEEKGNNP